MGASSGMKANSSKEEGAMDKKVEETTIEGGQSV